MNEVKTMNIKSLLSHNHPSNFSFALLDYLDEGFELHVDEDKGYHLDDPRSVNLIHETYGLIIFICAGAYFGTKLRVIKDPKNILEGQVVGKAPHLYDSLSYLNKNRGRRKLV